MPNDLFAEPGRFWRGNLHTHSNRSDGMLDPGEVCRRYEAEGYDFIAMTDHFTGNYGYPITDTRPFRSNRFTTLTGAEMHAGRMSNGELWHILAVGLPEEFAPPDVPDFTPRADQESAAALAARARQAGAFVAIAHPEWSGLTVEEAAGITAAHAVEVYNHGTAMHVDRGSGLYLLEQLLRRGRRLSLCANDDSHFRGDDHFGGWVMVKAAENTPEALLAALKAGHHYASQGPEFHAIHWEETAVEVECSPVRRVIVQAEGIMAPSRAGDAMTRARIALDGVAASPWLRVTLVDRAGRRAWSNPVWRTQDG